MMILFNTPHDFIEKIYINEREKLFYMAYEILKNEAEAEDAVHEAFLKLTEKSQNSQDYSKKSYSEMLRIINTIVMHEAYNIYRDHKKIAPFAKNDLSDEEYMLGSSPDALTQITREHDDDLVIQALMILPENDRTYLYLQYAGDLSPKTIAAMYDTSSSVVSKRVFHSKIKLAKILEAKKFRDLHPDT